MAQTDPRPEWETMLDEWEAERSPAEHRAILDSIAEGPSVADAAAALAEAERSNVPPYVVAALRVVHARAVARAAAR